MRGYLMALICSMVFLMACERTVVAAKSGDGNVYVTEGKSQEGKAMIKKGLGMPQAKRVGPPDVQPVTIAGVRYEALHWGRERGLDQEGGYIVAKDAASDKELWILKIYTVEYKPKLETDVQDIFIRSISPIENNRKLEIIDERDRQFTVDLGSRTVSPTPQ